MAKLTLVLGGARSGKSSYAENICLSDKQFKKRYIATAQVWDDEMRERVIHHQERRGKEWDITQECHIELGTHLLNTDDMSQITMIDCLTLWLTNEMLISETRDMNEVIENFTQNLKRLQAPHVFVSNEVGMGIVPENALARKFRDAQGLLNQKVAEVVDQVIFVAAGLPLKMK